MTTLRVVLFVAITCLVLGLSAPVSASDDSEAEDDSEHVEDRESENDEDDAEDRVVLPIVFPVDADHNYVNGWHFPRDGGARLHEGIDIMAERHSVLVATVGGVIETVRHSNSGLSGNMVVLKDDNGNRYYYIHLNNDEPGTDNGLNVFEQAFAPGIAEGVRVEAGDPIGFVGDSGNAENTAPHVHFGLNIATGETVNPYWSLTQADTEGQSDNLVSQLAITGPQSSRYIALGLISMIVGICMVAASAALTCQPSIRTTR